MKRVPQFAVASMICPVGIPLFMKAQFVIGFGDAWRAIALMLIVSAILVVVGIALGITSLARKERWPGLAVAGILLNVAVVFSLFFV